MITLNKIIHNALAATLVAIVGCSALPVDAAPATDGEVARPVTSMFTFDMGKASVRDTYVSPVTYDGTHLRLGYQALQATGFNPDGWVRDLDVAVIYDKVNNPVGNHIMHGLMLDASWSLMHRWRVAGNLQLLAGGSVMVRGGALYKPSNSNNVVSIKAHLGVGLAAMAVYPIKLRRLPITFSYQGSMPVVGAFYSPEYDQSYYEMYVGNHSGLVHPAWWGNRLEVNNLVSADFHLGNTILRLGYRNQVERSSIHNINTRMVSHSLVIGLGGNFLNSSHHPTHSVSAIY